jgi:hypothetical protein
VTQVLTYNTLSTDIQRFLEREGDVRLIEEIPAIIAYAESQLAREIKTLGTQVSVQGVLTVGSAIIQKPVRWRQTISLQIGTGAGLATFTPIFERAYEYVRNYSPLATATDQPRFYSDYLFDSIIVCPTPDQAYPFELVYYERAQPLDENNTTNWFTANAPDLLLNACLARAGTFMKDAATKALYQADLDRALQSLSVEDKSRITDRMQSQAGNT